MNHIKMDMKEAIESGFIDLERISTQLEIPISHLLECLFYHENSHILLCECENSMGQKHYFMLPQHADILKTLTNGVKKEYYVTKHGTYISKNAFKHYTCIEKDEEIENFEEDAKIFLECDLKWKTIESIYEQPPVGSYSLEGTNKLMKWDIRKKGIRSLYYHRILNDVEPIFADDERYRINRYIRPELF